MIRHPFQVSVAAAAVVAIERLFSGPVLLPTHDHDHGHQIGPGRQTVMGLHKKIEDQARRAAERRRRGRWAN